LIDRGGATTVLHAQDMARQLCKWVTPSRPLH
jgi:hypothetical protein